MAGFWGLDPQDIPPGLGFRRGKVRDILVHGELLALISTDRISAFDRVLGTVADRGEILNLLSVYWFQQTASILPSALHGSPCSRVSVMRQARPLPVEIIVRGYRAGSLLRDEGLCELWGISPRVGPYEPLPEPLLTPTTKAEAGHDLPLSRAEVLRRGLVAEEIWAQVERAALALFRFAAERLRARGLILVDTKYEMGILDGKLVLIDELHTPDSSRFWFEDEYHQALKRGQAPTGLDKEVLRAWLLRQGWSGEGEPPPLDGEILGEIAQRYRLAYHAATGVPFQPSGLGPAEVLRRAVAAL